MPTFNHKHFNKEESQAHHNSQRKYRKAYNHIYNTSRWRRLRQKILQQIPYCQQCWRDKSQYVYANVVDHIADHHGDERLAWDEANLQSLCRRCHDRKNGYNLQAKLNARKPKKSKGEVL